MYNAGIHHTLWFRGCMHMAVWKDHTSRWHTHACWSCGNDSTIVGDWDKQILSWHVDHTRAHASTHNLLLLISLLELCNDSYLYKTENKPSNCYVDVLITHTHTHTVLNILLRNSTWNSGILGFTVGSIQQGLSSLYMPCVHVCACT